MDTNDWMSNTDQATIPILFYQVTCSLIYGADSRLEITQGDHRENACINDPHVKCAVNLQTITAELASPHRTGARKVLSRPQPVFGDLLRNLEIP